MQITYSEILNSFKSQLSILGKRLREKDSLFPEVTISSQEEDAMIIHIDEAFSRFSSLSGIKGTFNSNGITYDSSEISKPLLGYLVSSLLYEFFSVVYPNLTSKYQADTERKLNTLLSSLEKEGVSSKEFDSVCGETSSYTR